MREIRSKDKILNSRIKREP